MASPEGRKNEKDGNDRPDPLENRGWEHGSRVEGRKRAIYLLLSPTYTEVVSRGAPEHTPLDDILDEVSSIRRFIGRILRREAPSLVAFALFQGGLPALISTETLTVHLEVRVMSYEWTRGSEPTGEAIHITLRRDHFGVEREARPQERLQFV